MHRNEPGRAVRNGRRGVGPASWAVVLALSLAQALASLGTACVQPTWCERANDCDPDQRCCAGVCRLPASDGEAGGRCAGGGPDDGGALPGDVGGDVGGDVAEGCPVELRATVDGACDWSVEPAELARAVAGGAVDALVCTGAPLSGHGPVRPGTGGRISFQCHDEHAPEETIDCDVPFVADDLAPPGLEANENVEWRLYESAAVPAGGWPRLAIRELCGITWADNCGMSHYDRVVAVASTPPADYVEQEDGSFVGPEAQTTDRELLVDPQTALESLDITYAAWDENAALLEEWDRYGAVVCHIRLVTTPP